jgi:hypothetical protein
VEGTPFGRYRLIELLGRGAMGEVWRAHDSTIDRVVAIKMLLPRYAQDPDFDKRFRREARAAAGLDDPHVVPIYDVGEIDGRLYVNHAPDQRHRSADTAQRGTTRARARRPHRRSDRLGPAQCTSGRTGAPPSTWPLPRDEPSPVPLPRCGLTPQPPQNPISELSGQGKWVQKGSCAVNLRITETSTRTGD